MLDQNIKTQLKAYLERLESPIELVAALDESDKAAQIKELVTEIAELSDKVTARFDGNNTRRPSFGVAKAGEQPRVFFAGLPMGHEFTSLILALLQVSGYAPKVSDEVLNQISVHDKFHRTLILSGFCLLKIAKISLNSSFFPKPIKR
ncbi:Alkyl hydroperoxide reductase subunit F [Acinetobacter nosocomialis]|nr:Alkyl hydroperoxide reductase subunit F [Acinetobacter nosocomialis]